MMRWINWIFAGSVFSVVMIPYGCDKSMNAHTAKELQHTNKMTQGDQNSMPFFNESNAGKFIGKTILIGVTYKNNNDEIVERKQYWGKILRINVKEGMVVANRNHEDDLLFFPPDTERPYRAEPGEYRLRSTGETVVDPDYLATWINRPNE